MRSRIIVGSLLLLGVFAAGTIATTGDGVAPPRQWATANFTDPVLVADQILMGPYLIVHDDAKMERGEPCTSFYRFDPVKGPQEAVLSFHCTPANRTLVGKTKSSGSSRATMVSSRSIPNWAKALSSKYFSRRPTKCFPTPRLNPNRSECVMPAFVNE